jgi:hypothetical protein
MPMMLLKKNGGGEIMTNYTDHVQSIAEKLAQDGFKREFCELQAKTKKKILEKAQVMVNLELDKTVNEG